MWRPDCIHALLATRRIKHHCMLQLTGVTFPALHAELEMAPFGYHMPGVGRLQDWRSWEGAFNKKHCLASIMLQQHFPATLCAAHIPACARSLECGPSTQPERGRTCAAWHHCRPTLSVRCAKHRSAQGSKLSATLEPHKVEHDGRCAASKRPDSAALHAAERRRHAVPAASRQRLTKTSRRM